MVAAIGIDVAEERKGLDVVALDRDHRIVERRSRATLEDVSDMVSVHRPEVLCIDSPPAWAHAGTSRAAERGLRAIGITAFLTPTDPGDHPFYRWMRAGFSIFDAVAAAGYPRYRSGGIAGTALEVFPEATAVALAGGRRSGTESKVVFRRRVLEANAVEASTLPNLDAVDAALAALTGVIALTGTFTAIGDPDEGVIVLPIASLPTARFAATASGDDVASAPPGPEPAPRPTAPNGGVLCGCGCGALVRRRFLPGHDATLKSRLLKLHHGGDADATAKLQALGWLPGSV